MKYYHAIGEFDRPHGEAFYGTNGALFSDRIGFEIYPDNDKIERRWVQSRDAVPEHTKKFIESVRSRKPSNADVEIGHRSTLIGHLGTIALTTGTKLEWDSDKEEFRNSTDANRLLSRTPRPEWKLY